MKLPHRKTQPEGLLDTIGESLGGLAGGTKRISLVKAGLIAGGVVALTAGSAAVSALRRRLGEAD
jgi:hypothetical protein